ncbi:Zinc finger protein CONSTANS-LIKE 3 [Quillaja saponaria]|uniref:Zinc finger protein CONSTANS-LIKE 3 n=1 Tax=Quillaja saponaria TaxID=32244 RepID=A0AAD7QIB4_QUISA|nr:Zinc finger protein CONSTANS-LIKE 3 [Quillaja saponaria]
MDSSVPQFYSNYTFPTTDHFYEFQTPATVAARNYYGGSGIESALLLGGHHDHHQDDHYNNFMTPLLDNMNIGSLDHHSLSPDSDIIMPSCADRMQSSLDQLSMLQELIADFQMASYGNLAGLGEECCRFVEDIKPPTYPAATTAKENRGIQSNIQMAAVEEPNSNVKVGRYSEEERKERILRYLKKRNQRNFNKTIKYACRKTLADRRVRVRGRFARNIELREEEIASKKKDNPHDHTHNKEEEFFYNAIQFKNDDHEEDWLQEAMTKLVHLYDGPQGDMYS